MAIWMLLVGLVFGGYAFLCFRYRRVHQYLSKLPSFPRLPILGNTHQLFGDGRVTFRIMADLSKVMQETRLPFVLWLGPYPIIVFSEPDDVKAISTTFLAKPYLYNFSRIWLGDGLVNAPTHLWKSTIKKLGGTFTNTVVETYLEVFNGQANKLVNTLKSQVGTEPFDVIHDLDHTTLGAICQIAFGVDISDSTVTKEYHKAVNRCLELFVSRGLNIFMHLDFIYRLSPAYKELLQCVSLIDNVYNTVIKKRKMEREDERKYSDGHQNDQGTERVQLKAYLDILMELHESDPTFTEEQVKAEVNTIIFGGQETVSTTLFYVFLMLGRHKHIQNKLYAELKEIFEDSIRPVQKDDLVRMRYCEAVLYETLRLFPPMPVVMRQAHKELQLKSCRVPSTAACAINAWAAGRSPRVWGPDAEEFKPGRWLHDEQPPGYPSSFFAFSYGRRACIGKRYAITIMKTVLAHCIRQLEIVSETRHLELKVDVALRAVSGHLIQVRLRK